MASLSSSWESPECHVILAMGEPAEHVNCVSI